MKDRAGKFEEVYLVNKGVEAEIEAIKSGKTKTKSIDEVKKKYISKRDKAGSESTE
jgi:hypothetical protein